MKMEIFITLHQTILPSKDSQNSVGILAGTGHRPDKIIYKGQNAYNSKVFNILSDFIEEHLKVLNPTLVITGMALGFDQALAMACINSNIKFHAYIPCPNQDLKWTKDSKILYKNLLEKAEKQVIISKEYTVNCMQKRNEHMVDATDKILALFNGSKGGTYNCIQYTNKPLINLWESWGKFCLKIHPICVKQ